MREGYLFTLCWANALLDSIFNCVSQATPELRSGWPTKSFGGYEGQAYRLNDSFALLTIKATGAQMPYVPAAMPVELTHSGCPIADPLEVGAVISWARTTFKLGRFDSAFVVPMLEAPSGPGGDATFKSFPADVQKMLIEEMEFERKRISAVLKGLAAVLAPPNVVVRASKVQVIKGDYVAGDKVHGNKIVNDASQKVMTNVTNSPGADVATTATNEGAVNSETAAIIEKIQELASTLQASKLGELQKEDLKTWIAESIEELQKQEKDRKPGKLEYTWGKIVGVVKQAKEVYDSVVPILTSIVTTVAPALLK